MRDELNRLLDERIDEAIITIRQAINSPGSNDYQIRSACHKLDAACELREAIDGLIADYFNVSVAPH